MSGDQGVRSLHAFVAMPFGIKENIDFDAVYQSFIRPALEEAGFEVLRADEEETAGNIRLDMFQELLLADLVLVDLTIDNPNVWYELGVRHALRSRGIVHVSSRNGRTPFDVATDRQFRYQLVEGVPDPATLDTQISALARVALRTTESWRGRKISPIYTLLPFLTEPDWKSLRVGASNEFWEQYEHWEQRIEIAGKRMRAGDILVLANEAPTQHLRMEAHRTAARALLDAGQFPFAVLQIDKALAVDPDDLKSARLKGLLLGRTGRDHAATAWLKDLLEKHPDDAEAFALLGRVRKSAWENTWNGDEVATGERRELAGDNDGIVLQALDAYRKGFESDPHHYYSGINALTMLRLYEHISLDEDRHRQLGRDLEGGLRWALASAQLRTPNDPWVHSTRGELELLCGNEPAAVRGYKDGIAGMRRDWFALDAVRQQLKLFDDLEFKPDIVRRVTRVVQRALENLRPPWQPRKIFLFSGHMVDKADRETRRFPDRPAVVAEARARIGAWLDERGACADDLALSSAACGGDLLFAGLALERGLRLDIRLPSSRPEFLRSSVAFAGTQWVEAFHTVTTASETRLRIMPDEIGPAPAGINEFARNNLWMLYSALAGGAERLQFLCLWNGQEGDGPGGTQDMVDTIRQHAGFADIIDSEELLEALPGDP